MRSRSAGGSLPDAWAVQSTALATTAQTAPLGTQGKRRSALIRYQSRI